MVKVGLGGYRKSEMVPAVGTVVKRLRRSR